MINLRHTKKRQNKWEWQIELRLGTNKNVRNGKVSYSRFSLIRFPLLIHTGTVVFNAISLNTMKVSLHWRFTDWQNIVCGKHFWLALRIPFMYIYIYICRAHIVMCVTKSKSKTKAENIVDTHSYVRDAYVFIVIRCGSAWQIRSEIFSLLGESWSCFQQVAK